MTVRKYRLISSGETTKQGRVFWISDPCVGSNDTNQNLVQTRRFVYHRQSSRSN